MPEIKKITALREESVAYMNQIVPVQESFDIIQRDIYIGGRVATFYFIDGFTKDEVLLKIMDSFLKVTKEDMPKDATGFARECIPYAEVDVYGDFDQVLKNLLSGVTCLFVDGYEACITIDCRTYPARSVEEPDKDKSLRGSRDGFVETIVFNTAMMRRRIRDPHLIMEMVEIGDSSRTDVAICYMKDRVDKALLDTVSKRIKSTQTDALRMNQQSLAECLFKRKWYNPFPKFKFTERPDTATACLLEGKVVILVDNSPSAMILPTSIFDMIEEANDYYLIVILKCPGWRKKKTPFSILPNPMHFNYINSSDEHKMLIDILTNNVRTAFFPFIFKYPPKEFYETVYRLLERDQKKGLLTEGINIRQAAYLFLAMDFIAACYKEIEGDADTPLLDLSYQFSKLFFHGIYKQADGWDELGTGYF